LREARVLGVVLALEQAELALTGVPRGAAMLREALDNGARLIATSLENHESLFSVHPLESRLEIVRISELCRSDTCRILEQLREAIGKHHAVDIDAEVERAAVERSLSLPGALPGKAVRLLDAAAARARLTGASSVTVLDVYLVASRLPAASV
jgi:ATP-dependent Clp protease ATP-binding subunit ClpA